MEVPPVDVPVVPALAIEADYRLDLLQNPRKLGVYLVFNTLRQILHTMVESVIRDYDLDIFDSKELCESLLEKDILHFMAPTSWEEEEDAMHWMSSVRNRRKTIIR
jgi:hypothetical protein